MQVNAEKLRKALEIVKPGLANREIIEQTTSFAFLNGRVITYNDEISISSPVEGIEFQGAVKADELYKFLSKVPAEEISIEAKEAEVILKAGRATVGLSLQKEIVLPLDEIEEAKGWKPFPKEFLEAISFSHQSCSRDMSRPVLTCVNVKENGIVEASDSFRLIQYSTGKKLTVPTFLLPASSARDLLRVKVKEVANTEGWIHFRDEAGTIFSCRVFAENFPDLTPILDMKGATKVNLPKELSDILGRSLIFAKQEVSFDETVIIKARGKNIRVKAQTGSGWFEEWGKMEKEVENPFSFQVNPSLLIDALKHLQECSIIPHSKIAFTGKNWVYIVALQTSQDEE